MSKLVPGNQKHMSKEDRMYIEKSLNEGKSFRDIARYLCKDPSTVSKEVKKHRMEDVTHHGSFNNPHNFCIHRYRCKKKNACDKIIICDYYCRSCIKCNQVCARFEREHCDRLAKAPFVCNGCDKPRHMCTLPVKYTYDAVFAQRKYEELRYSSRAGLNLTKREAHKIDAIVKPLIEQGQSPYMIITNHPELNISVKTLYNYINAGVLLSRNIDLKRKSKFKPRKCHKSQISNRAIFMHRIC